MMALWRLRWTGLGCLSIVLLAITLGLAGGAAAAVGPDGKTSGGLAIVAVLVAGGAVNWALGRRLNSEPAPEGRRRTDGHTLMDTPMEHVSVGFLVIALVVLASVIGRTTSPVLGWLTFALVLVGAVGLAIGHNERRARRQTIDRRALAHRRGWRYAPKQPGLGTRWKDLLGWRVAMSIGSFGVVVGEIDGLPFTVFDTMTGLDGRSTGEAVTIWAVHLPHAYPRLVVRRDPTAAAQHHAAGGNGPIGTAPTPLATECQMPGFGEAVLTPEVRSATTGWGLTGWQILGRDLVFAGSPRAAPTPADEVESVLERLAGLGRLLPPDLAARYGTAPDQDIPAMP